MHGVPTPFRSKYCILATVRLVSREIDVGWQVLAGIATGGRRVGNVGRIAAGQ